MLHVLTIALVVVKEIVDKVAGLHALKVAKDQATRQVTQIVATPVEAFVGAAKADAKDHALEAALVVQKEADFHFGWELQNQLHFPTFQTQTIMDKRFTLICLFLLAITGMEAQTTLCYHCYKKYDKNDIPENKNFYAYFTAKDNYSILYPSNKDGTCPTFPDGTPNKQLYKYTGKNVDGAMLYAYWGTDLYAWPYNPNKYIFQYHKYLLISEDWNEINFVWTGYVDGKYDSEPFTYCYKRCPFEDCDKATVPGMKH